MMLMRVLSLTLLLSCDFRPERQVGILIHDVKFYDLSPATIDALPIPPASKQVGPASISLPRCRPNRRSLPPRLIFLVWLVPDYDAAQLLLSVSDGMATLREALTVRHRILLRAPSVGHTQGIICDSLTL